MQLSIQISLVYETSQNCEILLQIEPTSDAEQTCLTSHMAVDPQMLRSSMPGEAGIGMRHWLTAGQRFDCAFSAQVVINRAVIDITRLAATPYPQLPADVIPYLMPSRYCQSDLFLDFAAAQFGHLSGGALAVAIGDWVRMNLRYDNAISNAATTAVDSFAAQSGVCRDFSHVTIALLRAAGLPARFVSAYAPRVTPQDFHAVADVYLDGGWHLIDATGMADASDILRICVGRDAADASFLMSYGGMDLISQSVDVQQTG